MSEQDVCGLQFRRIGDNAGNRERVEHPKKVSPDQRLAREPHYRECRFEEIPSEVSALPSQGFRFATNDHRLSIPQNGYDNGLRKKLQKKNLALFRPEQTHLERPQG
jgi:hypothetical protein